MIPLFPRFKRLDLRDKIDIEGITKQFPPYSDFNFISLWSYNTKNENEVSLLNKNLVVKFQHYQTLEPFYSFLGRNKVKKTIDILLDYAKNNGIIQELRLMSEDVINEENNIKNFYNIKEDRDNFDYILSIDDLLTLKGNKHGPRRNFINRFVKKYPDHKVVAVNIKNSKAQQEIKNLFYKWGKQQNKTRKETKNEFSALKRLLKSLINSKLVIIGVYVFNSLVCFSINEKVHDQHCILHFEKADISYTGSFQFLKQVTAQRLKKLRCKYLNYEQDLGIPGLRRAKESWRPVKYLKKYIISPKKNM